MKSFKLLITQLNIIDLSTIVFLIFLSLLNVIFSSIINKGIVLVLINPFIIAAIFYLAYKDKKTGNKFWTYIHYLYLLPIIFIAFKEVYFMLRPLRPNDYDYILISIDHFIFGVNPTQVLYKIANPFLTELLQIVYCTFYFLPVVLGVNLIQNKRWIELDYSIFCVVYGFFLSYLGYFIVPAIGPRFTLHNFFNLNNELPGVFSAEFLRYATNLGESISNTTVNPASVVQRDVFPSGHTQMTLIIMYLSARLNVKSKYFIIPDGVLLIFATVYLRYHYAVDLLGGLIFMLITMWSARYIFNWWQRYKGQEAFYLR